MRIPPRNGESGVSRSVPHRFWIPVLLFLFLQGCTSFDLTVVKMGDGQGIVTGFPDGTHCGAGCSNWTTPVSSTGGAVSLAAQPDIGSNVFTGWSGHCDNLGTAAYPPQQTGCAINQMSSPRKAYLAFLSAPPPAVSRQVTINKTGLGSVLPVPSQAGSCSGTGCMTFPQGVPVTFTALAESASIFQDWRGCDIVDGVDCTILVGAVDRTLDVRFTGFFPLTVNIVTDDGWGSGAVSAFPPGTPPLDCGGTDRAPGTTCSVSFATGAAFTLTAVANSISSFGSWQGCPGTVSPPDPVPESTFLSTCSGTMGGGPMSVTAKFVGVFTLNITKSGNGSGDVRAWVVQGAGYPPGSGGANAQIDCGANCSQQTGRFRAGQWIAIVANGLPFNHQSGWGGACHDTVGDTCWVQMGRASSSVSVNFSRP